jgi:hypothetical protein
MTMPSNVRSAFVACVLSALVGSASAQTYDVTVDGSDAVWLAGRTDLVIPAANLAWPGGLIRHGGPTPEEILESVPSFISVAAGDVIRALDPAVGGVSFYNGIGAPFFGPGGNGAVGSNLTAFGGISSYTGPQGPLVGVFLSDAVPSGAPPAGLDFSPSGVGIEFASLSPALKQIFYIGDGKTSADAFQTFIAPSGSTRLYFGIPDGFGFNGAPGAYDDNDGSYRVRIGVNQVPTPAIPESGTWALMLAGLVALPFLARLRRV